MKRIKPRIIATVILLGTVSAGYFLAAYGNLMLANGPYPGWGFIGTGATLSALSFLAIVAVWISMDSGDGMDNP